MLSGGSSSILSRALREPSCILSAFSITTVFLIPNGARRAQKSRLRIMNTGGAPGTKASSLAQVAAALAAASAAPGGETTLRGLLGRHGVELLLELAQEPRGFCEPRFLALIEEGVETPRQLSGCAGEEEGRGGTRRPSQQLESRRDFLGEAARAEQGEIGVDQ